MTSNLSNGRLAFLLVSCLSCLFSSLSVEGAYRIIVMRNIGASSQTFPVFGYWKTDSAPSMDSGSPDYYGSFSATLAPGATYTLATVDVAGWTTQSRHYGFKWNGVAFEMTPSDGRFVITTGSAEYQYLDVWDGPLPDKYIRFGVRNNSTSPVSLGIRIDDIDLGTSSFDGSTYEEMCLGPYTAAEVPLGNWWWYESGVGLAYNSSNQSVSQITTSNVFATGSSTWGTNCSVAVTPVTYGGTNASGIEWSRLNDSQWPTNTGTSMNTNLTNLAAINQIGFDSVVSAINKLSDRVGNLGQGGGTDNGALRTLTNQMGSVTGSLDSLKYYASNQFGIGTNGTGALLSGAWTNGVLDSMNSGSNSAYSGASAIGAKLGIGSPTMDGDTPSTEWTVPAMNGERIAFDIPWSGGAPVDGRNLAFPDWVASGIRALFAAAMVIGVWMYVCKDAIAQLKWLFTVNQTRVMKAQVLGTSVGLPVSLTLAAIVLGIIFALPAGQIALMETGALGSLSSVSTSLSTATSVGSGHGVWGLFATFVPVATLTASVGASVVWFATSNAMVLSVGALYKAFVAD